MEIQQRDNKTFAGYVHWFKTEAKRLSFNSDTAIMCIFNKGLWDTQKTVVKVCERYCQTFIKIHQASQKVQQSTTGYGHTDIF